MTELWASDGNGARAPARSPRTEHALPTGLMHLVVRLNDEPLHVLRSGSPLQRTAIRGAVVGGARSEFYVRQFNTPSLSVGVVLRPGAGAQLFGVGAHELAERHTPLEDLIGCAASRLRDRLCEAPGAAERLDLLEAFLTTRLPVVQGMHPAVARLFELVHSQASVRTAVRMSTLSHRHFIDQFRRSVGLTPKTYQRIRRFQHTLTLLRDGQAASMADLALWAGYADQSHLNREFQALAGMTPGQYAQRRPAQANHVSVAPS